MTGAMETKNSNDKETTTAANANGDVQLTVVENGDFNPRGSRRRPTSGENKKSG